MRIIHRQTDSLDHPNPSPARLPDWSDSGRQVAPPRPAPAWLWPVAVICACALAAATLALVWPFVSGLREEFDAMRAEHGPALRLLLFAAVTVVASGLTIGVVRLALGLGDWARNRAAAAGVVRLENDHPVTVLDLRRRRDWDVAARSVELHYATQSRWADQSGARSLTTYAPHVSYRNDQRQEGALLPEAAPAAPTAPILDPGRPALAQLAARGHLAPDRLLVGFDAGGEPQQIAMSGCGFVFVGGQTRSGKTTLVKLLLAQAAYHGWHVAVADPHHGKESGLLRQIQPMSGALMRQAVTPEEIGRLIQWVDKIGRRRLEGQAADHPVLLVIDEFSNLIIRGELDAPTLALLPAMAMAYAGVGVHAVIIGHDWSRAMLGGTYGATLRRAGTHRLVTRIAPDAAELLLPSPALARQAAGLAVGQALFWGDEAPVPVAVPLVGDADLEHAARGAPPRPYAPRAALPPPPAPLPPTTPLPEPTLAERIVSALGARAGDWTSGRQIAGDLGTDADTVYAELSRLSAAGAVRQRGRKRSYEYQLV
ncbi:MAG: hypothetical protein RLZZ387_2453 [Chloroflexota bacterium]|jgi:hypothetical protein